MAKQKVRKETVDIGKIAKASIIGGVSGFLGSDGARVKGSSYGMVTKSINVLNKYTKNNTYSSGTLSMYKTYLTGTKNFLKPIVTKKTTDGYLKGTLATVLGNYGKNIWKTWFQIIWSLIFVIGNWSYVLLYTVTDDYIEWIFLIGALGCVCVGICFDTVIKRKCFLNRYKKFTFDNFFYFFGIIKNIPPIIECEECVVVGVRTRKKNLVDVKTVLTGIIYQNVFVEDKYIDREFSIYQLYEICGLKYIVPQHLSETIKRDSSDWFVDRNGNQIWP